MCLPRGNRRHNQRQTQPTADTKGGSLPPRSPLVPTAPSTRCIPQQTLGICILAKFAAEQRKPPCVEGARSWEADIGVPRAGSRRDLAGKPRRQPRLHLRVQAVRVDRPAGCAALTAPHARGNRTLARAWCGRGAGCKPCLAWDGAGVVRACPFPSVRAGGPRRSVPPPELRRRSEHVTQEQAVIPQESQEQRPLLRPLDAERVHRCGQHAQEPLEPGRCPLLVGNNGFQHRDDKF
eukprot:gene9878-biopygen22761